jgi:hypothetical protein
VSTLQVFMRVQGIYFCENFLCLPALEVLRAESSSQLRRDALR